jgi:putative transposase
MRSLNLQEKERSFLALFIRTGKKSARSVGRANILLLLDQGNTGDEIAKMQRVNRDTVYNLKRRYLNEGLERALNEKPRSGQPTKYNKKQHAEIIALACTDPPVGRKRWSVRLLTQTLQKKSGFETVNRETIRVTLKKAGQSPG